jgi:hypothetical protein
MVNLEGCRGWDLALRDRLLICRDIPVDIDTVEAYLVRCCVNDEEKGVIFRGWLVHYFAIRLVWIPLSDENEACDNRSSDDPMLSSSVLTSSHRVSCC